jgi:hypothetical protein
MPFHVGDAVGIIEILRLRNRRAERAGFFAQDDRYEERIKPAQPSSSPD